MRGQAMVAGARQLLVFLIKTVLFPLTWMWAWKIAKKHEDADPGGQRKVAMAIVIGLFAAGGIGYMIYDFQETARDGMYENLAGRLSVAYGANAHGEQTASANSAQGVVEILETNLADASAERMAILAAYRAADSDAARAENLTLYEEVVAKQVDLSYNADLTRLGLEQNLRWRDRLTEESAFFDSVSDELANKDDVALRAAAVQRLRAFDNGEIATALIDAEAARDKAVSDVAIAAKDLLHFDLLEEIRGLSQTELEARAMAEDGYAASTQAETEATQAHQVALSAALAAGIELPVPDSVYEGDRVVRGTDYWLAIKDESEAAMAGWMNYLIFPGLIGVFYAPLIFALGSIMGRAWDPSETVGYKPYPGKSLGIVLLLGAFGWPAILFSAWGFWDLDVRSQEGQISL